MYLLHMYIAELQNIRVLFTVQACIQYPFRLYFCEIWQGSGAPRHP